MNIFPYKWITNTLCYFSLWNALSAPSCIYKKGMKIKNVVIVCLLNFPMLKYFKYVCINDILFCTEWGIKKDLNFDNVE